MFRNIFNSFVIVSERMLKDHLEDGKYGNPTPDLILQSKSTATTNAVAEPILGCWTDKKNLNQKHLTKATRQQAGEQSYCKSN